MAGNGSDIKIFDNLADSRLYAVVQVIDSVMYELIDRVSDMLRKDLGDGVDDEFVVALLMAYLLGYWAGYRQADDSEPDDAGGMTQ